MIGKLVKKTLLFACLLTLCNLTLFAQAVIHPQIVHAPEKSAIHVPPQETEAALKKIYSNLGKSPTNLYVGQCWAVSGPNSGMTEFIAMPFTPKFNSHVSQVRVALQYYTGANQVNLSIYGDSSGAPGTLLAGPVTVTNLPETGTCCTLAIANFSPVAVSEGTRYWVAADTPLSGTGSDFNGGWCWVPVPTYLQAGSDGFGWSGFNGTPSEAAGEVLGTIP